MMSITSFFCYQKIRLGQSIITVYSDRDKIKVIQSHVNLISNDFLTIIKSIKSDVDKLEAIKAWLTNLTTLQEEKSCINIIKVLNSDTCKLKAINLFKNKHNWNSVTTLITFLPLFKDETVIFNRL